MTRSGAITTGLCLVIIWLASRMLFAPVVSPDLSATVFAGHFWNLGRPDEIYHLSSDGVFRFLPPASWSAWLNAEGYTAPIYPYIYPPIWIAAGAALDHFSNPAEVSRVAYLINPVLYWATLYLALRTSVSKHAVPRLLLLSVVLSFPTWTVIVALAANQPQILVSFLTVLAIERSRSGFPRAAGVALALAAALKLYPALFVVIWLAQRQYRAAVAFVLSGCILAALSIGMMGWQLNLDYLKVVNSISGSFLSSPNAVSLDCLAATHLFRDGLEPVEIAKAGGAGEASFWLVGPKPTIYRLVALGVFALVLVGLAALARRRTSDQVLVWALAVTVVSLVSPLSWAYSYIATFAFLPVLATRVPAWFFAGMAALIVVPFSMILGMLLPPWFPGLQWSVAGLSAYAVVLVGLILRSRAQVSQRPGAVHKKSDASEPRQAVLPQSG